MVGGKRKIDSQAVRVRTAFFFVIANVNGVCEVHVGYRYYDQSVGLYSTAPSNSPCKPPWGAIKKCELQQDVKNGKGEKADYYQIENEKGEKRLFKTTMMNPLVWGINDFTQQVAGMRVGHKEEILGVYLTFLNSSKDFVNHNPLLHDELGFEIDKYDSQIEEMELKMGNLAEFKSFLNNAVESAMMVDHRKDVLEQISTKANKTSAEVNYKRSKQEVIEAEKQEEINDENGMEQIFTNSYIGRAQVSIDRLSISKKVCTPINMYKVLGLAKSISNRCDPSNLVLTVVPKDEASFDENQLEANDYEVINGRHRLGALLHLDKKNGLASLTGLEDRTVVCYVLKTSCAIQVNYGQLRGNELQASFVRKPHVHEIVYVAEGLKELYPMNQVQDALIRYCKLLSIHPDEVTALKKIVQWPKNSFDALVGVLKLFESYQTADVKKSSDLEKIKVVPKAIFRQLGQVDYKYSPKCKKYPMV